MENLGEPKSRIKMYKAGKLWLFSASLVVTMMGAGAGLAHADTVTNTSDTNASVISLPTSQAASSQAQTTSIANSQSSTAASNASSAASQDTAKSATSVATSADSTASQSAASQTTAKTDSVAQATQSSATSASSTASQAAVSANVQNLGNATDSQVNAAKSAAAVTYAATGTPQSLTRTDATAQSGTVTITKDNFLNNVTLNGTADGTTDAANGGVIFTTKGSQHEGGSFNLNQQMDLNQDFTIDGDVNLGDTGQTGAWGGGDGIGFSFSVAPVGTIGQTGNAMGVGGLQDAFGFKLDTFYNDDNQSTYLADPTAFAGNGYGQGESFGAFIQTNSSDQAVSDPTTAEQISGADNQWHHIVFKYTASNHTITVTYTDGLGDHTFTKQFTDLEANPYRTFSVSSSTGSATNTQQFRINQINYTTAGQVTVFYRDKATGKSILPQSSNTFTDPTTGDQAIVLTGRSDETYTTDQKAFAGYSYDSADAPTNATGTFDGNTTVTYYYTADTQYAYVQYLDDTVTDKTSSAYTLQSDPVSGPSGTTINYQTAGTIAQWHAKGYDLDTVNGGDGFPVSGATYDYDDGVNQFFYVHLTHHIQPITPDQPGVPGQPIDPSNPTGPKWPSDINKTANVDQKVNEDVHYVMSDGSTAPVDQTDQVEFTRTATIDSTNNQVTFTSDWAAKNGDTTFGAKTTPVVPGYYADQKQVDEITGLTATSGDKNFTVTYKPMANLVPTSTDPNFKTPGNTQYPNDPTDPTKPGQVTVPNVPGFTPHDGSGNPLTPGSTITPTNPGQDTPITYTANDEHATVTYIDDTTGKTLDSADTLTGKFDTTDSYRTSTRINGYEAKGYQLVSDDYPANGVVYNQDGTTQNFTVHLAHIIKPITPDQPGVPGQPIDPSNPTGPKWPSNTDKGSLDVVDHETVHYVTSDGSKAPADQTDQVEFTRTGTVDAVTGDVTYTDWVAKDGDTTFGAKTTPVVPGYYADQKQVDEITGLTATSGDKNFTVTYKPMANLVPTSTDPNFKTPGNTQYPNDPTDPTKPGQVTVPNVPGFTPHDGSGNPLTPGSTITPTNPGQDTPITYTANDETAIVQYVDDDNNGKVLSEKDLTGKFDTTDAYRSTDTIQGYEKQGYTYVPSATDYPSTGVVYNQDGTVQKFTVHFKHTLTPITPDKPGNPGQPIDPSNPTGPKWPSNTDKGSLDVVDHETVHYVTSDGSKAPADQTDQVEFTRTGTVDEANGNVTYTDWVAKDGDTTFSAKTTPVVPGYYADQKQVDEITGLTETSGDKNFTVTYKPMANLVPTPSDPNDPNWPKTPSTQYPNDPTDPTKPGQVTVPDVPGYTPHDGNGNPLTPGSTITPTTPGQDTPITYTANNYTVTANYVDGDGNPVHPATVQTDQHIGDKYTTTSVVVDGYYLTAIPTNVSGTVGDSDVTVTYVYAKMGHLVPDVPGVPGVVYPNDPSDPTKPGQPLIPDVPGYTPVDKNGNPLVPGTPYPVDPDHPGQDTPIHYVKNVVPNQPGDGNINVGYDRNGKHSHNVTTDVDEAGTKGHGQKTKTMTKTSANMAALPETGEQHHDGSEEAAGLTMIGLAGLGLGFLGFRRKNER